MIATPVIRRIDAVAYRVPIARPVETSFGRMTDRPAVFVRVEASDGAFGWGEVFANWPAAGAEHRVNLLARDIAPLLLGTPLVDPAATFDRLSRQTHIRALQCGEWGPFRQVVAGLDTALWDLAARAAGKPLRHLLRADAPDEVPAYASGIHIAVASEVVPAASAQGYRAFKVKVGFDEKEDIRRLDTLARSLATAERLFTDANQGFDADTARDFLARTEDLRLGWLEEPIPADAPPEDWARLAACSATPLAAGENVAGEADFAALVAGGAVRFVQPDVAKWGGVTGCLRVARAAMAGGRTYCPHFLGGGIGLVASAELLAAAGGEGLLEVDVNPNPLREAFGFSGPRDGLWPCATGPGLGIEAPPAELAPFVSHSVSLTG